MTEQQKITIHPAAFNGLGTCGDFDFMIRSGEYNDALFIFNDNEEHHDSSREGSGNAIIRKYNKFSGQHIYSAGIPTGLLYKNDSLIDSYKGYKHLNERTKYVIDSSIEEIKEILTTYDYRRIFYSSDKNGVLGSKLFKVNDEVLRYITEQIYSLKC